jgi:FMN phosphatase YigB (HAD superfamily)/carbamoylphosphate synthase large subunit
MRWTNVLVVSGGGFQGLSLVKALRAVTGIRILVADCYAENVTRYFADAFFLVPLLKEEQAFLDFVLDLCGRESVTAVFASTEYELELLARHRDAFAAEGATVYVSDISLLELARDKLLFYRWLLSENLPCLPCYAEPHDKNAVFPLIGKPRGGWGGRNLHILADRDAVSTISIDENDKFVWQPCLEEFDEYSVDFSVNVTGEISPLGFRRRIRSMGGFAILCEPGAPKNVREAAQRVLERLALLGARGPMNLQILQVGDTCWVSDLNPRAGTSMPLSLAAGLNPLAFLLNDSADEVHNASGSSELGSGARTLRYLEERSIPDLRLNEVRGVVFDLDDTLLDQKAWMVSKLEVTWHTEMAILPERAVFLSMALQIIEEGNRAGLFDALCLELGLDDTIRLRLIEAYRKARPADRPIYGDVFPALYQLRRLGYRIGVLTDNPPASQRQKLDVCGLAQLIDTVVLTEELRTRKPDPEVFAKCARLLDLPSEQLVMVGDNLFRDMKGAIDAGYRHAFHIKRMGAFFNFNPELVRRVSSAGPVSTAITNLTELFWHLGGVQNNDTTPCQASLAGSHSPPGVGKRIPG